MNREDAAVGRKTERQHRDFDDLVDRWIQPGGFDIEKYSAPDVGSIGYVVLRTRLDPSKGSIPAGRLQQRRHAIQFTNIRIIDHGSCRIRCAKFVPKKWQP